MQEIKHLTPSETRLLYAEIYRDKSKHRLRNIAIFELAKYCALRASEISIMKLDSYDRENHNIYCYRLKKSDSNTLKIVDKHVLKALEDYLCEREYYEIESPYLFVSQKGCPISRQRMDALMKYYCQNINTIPLNKRHMHILRHTRAVELAESGFDVDDIQYWLGHKNSENTFKYLSFTTTLKRQLFFKLEEIEAGEYTLRF